MKAGSNSGRAGGTRLVAALIATIAGVSVLAIAPAAARDRCTQYSVPVTLSTTDATTYHLAGWLCGPARGGGTVQILSPGGWYSHAYWDWPIQPQTYSYVSAMSAAGYATFSVDRIGIGQSDHPPANLVTLQAEAYVTHQLVGDLRAGRIGGADFERVVLVGHSFGSFLSIYEAATYGDVDGVLSTGSLTTPGSGFGRLFSSLYPAQLDPRFASANLPLGYVTTRPGVRGGLFYDLAAADPAVIALDEATKETATAGEAETFYDYTTVTRQVHTPVLQAVGEHDIFFCDVACGQPGSATAIEPGYWAADACLEEFVLPNSGHDIDLHPNAPSFFAAAIDWLNRRVGDGDNDGPGQPCRGVHTADRRGTSR